jgi:hypothetical protein
MFSKVSNDGGEAWVFVTGGVSRTETGGTKGAEKWNLLYLRHPKRD